MEKQITLSLPQTLYEQAVWLGSATQRETAEVLTDALSRGEGQLRSLGGGV